MESAESTFGRLAEELRSDPPLAQLDEIDLRLLSLLLGDGRATLKSLAAAVNLSAPAVSERMTRLKKEGVIRGYQVDIDWRALGYSLVTYLNIRIRTGFNREDVLRDLQRVPEVEETSVITGPSDLIVRIRTVDFEHLKRILAEHLWMRNDLESTETRLAFISEESTRVERERLERLLAELDNDD